MKSRRDLDCPSRFFLVSGGNFSSERVFSGGVRWSWEYQIVFFYSVTCPESMKDA